MNKLRFILFLAVMGLLIGQASASEFFEYNNSFTRLSVTIPSTPNNPNGTLPTYFGSMYQAGSDICYAAQDISGHIVIYCSPDFENWYVQESGGAIVDGTTGTWDDTTVLTPSVFCGNPTTFTKIECASTETKTYYMTYQGRNESVHKVGLATSSNGKTGWTKDPRNPIYADPNLPFNTDDTEILGSGWVNNTHVVYWYNTLNSVRRVGNAVANMSDIYNATPDSENLIFDTSGTGYEMYHFMPGMFVLNGIFYLGVMQQNNSMNWARLYLYNSSDYRMRNTTRNLSGVVFEPNMDNPSSWDYKDLDTPSFIVNNESALLAYSGSSDGSNLWASGFAYKLNRQHDNYIQHGLGLIETWDDWTLGADLYINSSKISHNGTINTYTNGTAFATGITEISTESLETDRDDYVGNLFVPEKPHITGVYTKNTVTGIPPTRYVSFFTNLTQNPIKLGSSYYYQPITGWNFYPIDIILDTRTTYIVAATSNATGGTLNTTNKILNGGTTPSTYSSGWTVYSNDDGINWQAFETYDTSMIIVYANFTNTSQTNESDAGSSNTFYIVNMSVNIPSETSMTFKYGLSDTSPATISQTVALSNGMNNITLTGSGRYFNKQIDYNTTNSSVAPELISIKEQYQAVSEGTYNITGYVNDTIGNPLESVSVTNNSGNTATNATGYYELVGLSDGTYNFTYSKSGYVTGYKDITISGTDMSNQNVTLQFDNYIPPPYPTIRNDNFSDNSFNTSLWRSNLSGTGTVEETSEKIFINETASSSAAIVSTLEYADTYTFDIDINVTSLNTGTIGLMFQDTYPQTGTNAYVTSVVRGGIVFSQGLAGIAVYYYNLSSGMVYWNESGNTWGTTPTSIPYLLNSNYTFTIERHLYFYYFKVTNSSGTVMESDPIFSKVVRGGATVQDYVYFGDAINNNGWANATFDNANINVSDSVIPFQNNMANDIDAYYRMTEDFCHACWSMGTGVDGWWQYSTFNDTHIIGMETTGWFDHPNDPNNLTFTTNLFTENGIYRLNVPSIPLTTVTESVYQPFEVYNITDNRGFRINGTYPNYYLYVNGTTQTGETLSINLTYNLMPAQEHWFRTDGFYYVAPSNVSGTIILDGTTYIISNGFSSWEHGWGEENIDVGSSGGGGEYYHVFPVNGFNNGSSIYYRMNAAGTPVIRDAGMNQNGYEWYNATYKALERTVNGTWQIITKWNVSSVDSSSGMSINYTGQLLSQYGIGPGADGGTGASRGVYNITGNYTYPNATIINISANSIGYHQVAIDTLNPIWKFVTCTYGCQNVSAINISSGYVIANWTAFNSSYLIQNVYFNVTYPNATTITDRQATLHSGNTQSGVWGYPIDSAQGGNYAITVWSNDSRGVWNRTENIVTVNAVLVDIVEQIQVIFI